MNNYPPSYPANLFPKGHLPENVIKTANLAVRCRYAEAGAYGAALLLRTDEGIKNCRIVIEPVEVIDDWIEKFTEHAKNTGVGEFTPRALTINDVMDVHRQSLDELEAMVKSLREGI